MECRVIFYFQELTNIQAGDVVGISSRQKSVFCIGQLRTYLQEVGRGDFPRLDRFTGLFLLYFQSFDRLFGIADVLFGAKNLQIIGRDIEPDVVAGLLHTQQRRTQIEAGAFEVMEIPHTVE